MQTTTTTHPRWLQVFENDILLWADFTFLRFRSCDVQWHLCDGFCLLTNWQYNMWYRLYCFPCPCVHGLVSVLWCFSQDSHLWTNAVLIVGIFCGTLNMWMAKYSQIYDRETTILVQFESHYDGYIGCVITPNISSTQYCFFFMSVLFVDWSLERVPESGDGTVILKLHALRSVSIVWWVGIDMSKLREMFVETYESQYY